MFSLFFQCIRSFGIHGLLIYARLKTGLTDGFRLPGIKEPIFLRRNNKSDRITFREILLKKEYDINNTGIIDPRYIIDAGANIGLTSVFFANKYPEAKILSIEPDEGNFRLLTENTRNYINIKPIRSALWHQEEIITTIDKGFGDRGFITEKSEEQTGLSAISVSGLMKKFSMTHIDILKIDIEGSEKEVFSSHYESWLPLTRCLIIELHDRMKRDCSKTVFKALGKYDFSFSIKGENLVFVNNQEIGNS